MANKRQMAKAARLWSLAVIAHMDQCVYDEDANALRAVATEQAELKLENLGYRCQDLLSELDCIKAVQQQGKI